MAWAALTDAIPLYPLYALLFADTGLSEAEISALFIIWSVVGVLAEVPSGALADRWSRRGTLVAGGLLTALGYLLWIALPGFAGFAAGFVLWGVGGALASGSFQALVYDGLAAAGAADRYATVIGRSEAAALAVQLPVAGVASALFALGGYALAGVVSIAICLAAAALGTTLPDVRPVEAVAWEDDDEDPELGYLATLRAGVHEAAVSPGVRACVVAVALLTSFEGLEEIFPLLAEGWGVSEEWVPLALMPVALAGALGSALAAKGARLGVLATRAMLLAAAGAFAAALAIAVPAGIVGLTLFYGLFRVAIVVADVRLQDAIDGPARATVTSVSTVGTELSSVALFGLWALGGGALVAGLAILLALALPLGRAWQASAARRDAEQPRDPATVP